MLFWRKERQVEKSIEEYLQELEACVASFGEAIEVLLTDGLAPRFEELTDQTHRHEHACDTMRRNIELDMYGNALIPESRGDVLGMLEGLDLVPNQCESVLHQIWTQNMTIPEPCRADFRELVKTNMHACSEMVRTVRALFAKVDLVIEGANCVSEMEAQSDTLERTLIKTIFDSDMDTAEKILLKELVLEVGSISDRAENASDRLRIVAVKRQS